MTDKRQIIVSEARSWIGTKFRHQGRTKGIGCDCAGVLVGIAKIINMKLIDMRGYGRTPFGGQLKKTMDEQFDPVLISHVCPGDILLLRVRKEPQHLAIVADYKYGGLSIIHSTSDIGRVVEHRFDVAVKKKIVAAYKFPGVDRG